MKRMIKDYIQLNVIINLDYIYTDIAASEVNHPKNIRKSNRLDEAKLTILNDIVDSVVSVIRSYHFDIIKKYQSSKSYTYYIWFEPKTSDGRKLIPVKIVFRISGDHRSKSMEGAISEGVQVIVRSINIGEDEYKDVLGVMNKVDKICKELSVGNLSELYN